MMFAAALIAGGFIGAVLGFIGAGGAMLSVPILIYIFDFTPQQATTAALAVVFLAALAGAAPKIGSKEILYRDALIIWSIGLVPNLALSSIADSLPERFITGGFSIVLIFAGVSMMRTRLNEVHTRIPVSRLILISIVVGSITGLFGIGGGFLVIPVLVLYFGTKENVAAGTSLLIICLNSITALLGHYKLWSEVDWHIPATMALSAVIVASTASRFGKVSSPEILRRAFAVLLFAVAGFTLLQALLQF